MTAGSRYRKIAAKREKAAKAHENDWRIAHAKSIGKWFNEIAAQVPAAVNKAIKKGGGMSWTYPSEYHSAPYERTAGYKAFNRVCKKLDVDYDCETEQGFDMCDNKITELRVTLRPDRPYGAGPDREPIDYTR